MDQWQWITKHIYPEAKEGSLTRMKDTIRCFHTMKSVMVLPHMVLPHIMDHSSINPVLRIIHESDDKELPF